MRWSRGFVALGLLLAGACRSAPPRDLPAPTPLPLARVFPAPDTVWTTREGVVLRTPGGDAILRRPFTRLDVFGADSLSLQVRCAVCGDSLAGWVERSAVIHEPTSLDSAAVGDLAGFALAVRAAAVARDQIGLRRVMSTDFSFSALGTYGRDLALSSWFSENFRTLDRVPAMLDAGLSSLNGLWVAPPAFAMTADYRGLRLGFHRTADGRWEWTYLVQGENP